MAAALAAVVFMAAALEASGVVALAVGSLAAVLVGLASWPAAASQQLERLEEREALAVVSLAAGGPGDSPHNVPYRRLVILGNNGPSGDLFLPDRMTAAEFTDFTARRCGASKVSSAVWASRPPTKPWGKSNGKTGFVSQMVIAPFNRPPVAGDLTEIRHNQRKLLRQKIDFIAFIPIHISSKRRRGSGKLHRIFIW
jgi:hypothetical protein